MTRVTDYSALSDRLGQLLYAGAVPNGLPEAGTLRREIAAGTLYLEDLPEGVLLYRDRGTFRRMSFLLEDPAVLLRRRPAAGTALELPWSQRNPRLRDLGEALLRQGWTPLVRRARITRAAAPAPAAPDAAIDWAPAPAEVLRILERCYVPVSGCLPTEEELAAEGTMLLPGAALHYRRHGSATEMRHLAVVPEERGRGLAKRLITAFLDREGCRLSRLWADGENEGLLRMYRGFGYLPDGWHSLVLYAP